MVGSIKGWISVLFRGAGGNGSIGRNFVGGKLESRASIIVLRLFVASLCLGSGFWFWCQVCARK